MTRPRPLARASALALAFAPLAAAEDLWVGPLETGLPFQEIQDAVDAANPSDRIFVVAGDYGPVTITKPIQISGDGSDVTRIVGLADGTGQGRPAISVSGVGPGDRVWINGFQLEVDDAATTPATRLFEMVNVQAPLELCDLKVYRESLDSTAPGGSGAYVHVENCPRVFGSDVRVITAAVAEVAATAVEPFVGLRAIGSYVSFSEARFDAAWTPSALAGVELSGSPAIDVLNSTLVLALTTAKAGDRGDQGANPAVTAGDGIRAAGSLVKIHGGKNNGVQGGHSTWAAGPGVAAAGAAVRLDAQSSLDYGADVLLAGGQGPSESSAQAVVADPAASVTARADNLPTMWIGNPIGELGTFPAVFLEGDVGAVQLWWLAFWTGPPLAIGGFDGLWWMDTTLLIHHPPIVIPESGIGTDVAWVPNSVNILGLALCYQSLELDGVNFQFAPPWFASIELY